MKKILALTLALTLLLCGCGGANAAAPETTAAAPAVEQTQAPTTEPTTVPTTEPEVYRNPLNGEVLDAPFTDRIFANTVSNMQDNLPHVGVTTRSTRPIFNQIAQHYDLVLSHAGGSSQALDDAKSRGIDNFNIDSWEVSSQGTSYRDTEYNRTYENTLFGVGSGIKAYAEAQGVQMNLERDYGLEFTENGTPADGETADTISLVFTFEGAKKETVMTYDAEAGKYVFNQYGQVMKDQITDETEMFTNVIIMNTQISTTGIYHIADFNAGGTGYYANGGKIIPIAWTCDADTEPFRFFHEDGTPLEIGVGNSYIAIAPDGSPVTYTAAEPVAETTAATTAE